MKNLLLFIFTILLSNLTYSQKVGIIPQPNEVKLGKGAFVINYQTSIISDFKSEKTALFLKSKINESLGLQLANTEEGNTIAFEENQALSSDSYHLNIEKNKIQIIASSDEGWLYGVQSLLQLIDHEKNLKAEKVSKVILQSMFIADAPQFKWRSFMLDESRYFKGKEEVKKLLDEMSYLKMNIFHWHLVDDQGWRIEIKKYPKLTEIGSKRESTQLEWYSSKKFSGETHSGYYTQEDIKEIVQYAADLNIKVIPEIEMPGHSAAAIASYSWLGASKKDIEVPTTFGKNPNVYDVSDPKVYAFLTDVLDEVVALFPSRIIHIGGDEVKFDHWKESESIQSYMKENDLNTPLELQIFFTNKISRYLAEKGVRMMGWNDILGGKLHQYQDVDDLSSNQKLAEETIVHFWKGDISLMEDAAKKGYDIVNSVHTHTYLDYNYKSIPLEKAYHFDLIPVDLHKKYHSKIIGTGSQMWGEWIPTNGEMHYMVYPRIAAYAETSWSKGDHKDYDTFLSNLKNLQIRWEKKGILYAEDVIEVPSKEGK